MTNSVDPDQLASTLFAKAEHILFSRMMVKSSPNDRRRNYYMLGDIFKLQIYFSKTLALHVISTMSIYRGTGEDVW